MFLRLARRLVVCRRLGLRNGLSWCRSLSDLRMAHLLTLGRGWPRAYGPKSQILWKIVIEIDCGLFSKTRYVSGVLGASEFRRTSIVAMPAAASSAPPPIAAEAFSLAFQAILAGRPELTAVPRAEPGQAEFPPRLRLHLPLRFPCRRREQRFHSVKVRKIALHGRACACACGVVGVCRHLRQPLPPLLRRWGSDGASMCTAFVSPAAGGGTASEPRSREK